MEHEDAKHDADCPCEKCEARRAEQFGKTMAKDDVAENLKKQSSEAPGKRTQGSVARGTTEGAVDPIPLPTTDVSNTD